MRVLVVGAGAREHALVRSLLADPSVTAVVAAPGNAGIAAEVPVRALDLADSEALPSAVASLAVAEDADLVVIGPEGPLVAGAADAVRAKGIACFGPSAEAARLEGSKAYAKEVMAAAGVPTADSRTCTTSVEVHAALEQFGAPYVVKADGLAAGKGVVVTSDRDVATAHADGCLRGGGRVVIEDYLDGPEVSLFVLCDGDSALPLPPARDFKRVGDGDTGPNTGGMGAYAPVAEALDVVPEVMAQVVEPTLAEMRRRGTPYTGLLYVGLALTSRGMRVVEFNARFGDPETQVVLPLLDVPLGRLLHASATGALAQEPAVAVRPGAAVTVVVAAPGYPAAPVLGGAVEGVGDVTPPAYVLHAGTREDAGAVVSSGGRVLSVTAVGADLAAAREAVYAGMAAVRLEGAVFRSDIAASAAAAP